jgi:hypothetical protein
MEFVGIERNIDDLGRIVIPKVEEPRVYTIKEGYNNQQFIIKITPEQDRLLDYLLDNDLLDSNLAIHTGYPEIEDLT